MYCSPSQSQREFEHFFLSLENLLCNIRSKDPAFTVLLDDFNARSKSWWVHYTTNKEGTQIESISSLYGFSQLILEHTSFKIHRPALNSFLQINPIYSGIKPSLHENCHHQIIYAKFNLQIVYPPPYQRLAWDYKKSNVSSIQKALNMSDRNKLFSNANAKKQVYIPNDTLLDIFSNFVRSKVITINDRDPP